MLAAALALVNVVCPAFVPRELNKPTFKAPTLFVSKDPSALYPQKKEEPAVAAPKETRVISVPAASKRIAPSPLDDKPIPEPVYVPT
jgi:hypothetical protein